MAFEIDYLPVGEGEKGGDCIALRFWNPAVGISSQKVVVIDGGYKPTGEQLLRHIRQYYETDVVDLVISTHPDMDHTSGLSVILDNLRVGALLMHRPWIYSTHIRDGFQSGNLTSAGISETLHDSLTHASELEKLATQKGVPIYEPYEGLQGFDGLMHVLGPSQNFYTQLLPHFRGTPDPAYPLDTVGMVQKGADGENMLIPDAPHINLLDDEDATDPANNTSAITLFNIDGQKILFTGDAGIRAIEHAINYAHSKGISLTDLDVLHVPHHGSKRNMGKTMMQHMRAKQAHISAPPDSTKHPSKKIINHLMKIGSTVFTTQGKHLYYYSGVPIRENWSFAVPAEFSPVVEK